jgi:hypothetical protein
VKGRVANKPPREGAEGEVAMTLRSLRMERYGLGGIAFPGNADNLSKLPSSELSLDFVAISMWNGELARPYPRDMSNLGLSAGFRLAGAGGKLIREGNQGKEGNCSCISGAVSSNVR